MMGSQAKTFNQIFMNMSLESSHENKSRSHKIVISKTPSWSLLVSFTEKRQSKLCYIRMVQPNLFDPSNQQ